MSVNVGLLTTKPVYVTNGYMNVSELMDYLEENVGERLRAVGYHDGDEIDAEYIRPDVTSEYTEDQINRLKEWITGDFAAERFEELYAMEGLEYVVQKFDEAVVVIIYTETGGLLVSVDSDVDIMPSHFVHECLERIEMEER